MTTSPPPLEVDSADVEISNTLALLLPSQSLFAHPILAILKDFYASYGTLAHWAPVKGFGRVILVYEDEADAVRAKKEGDRLKLDVKVPEDEIAREGYFKRRRKSDGLILRLHYLPPTPLYQDPADLHLRPPEHEKNFLISPPGSPPEGWEPIVEDGPNTSTLADDLQKALERIQLNGKRRGSKEIILEEGGVRVEVEDTEVQGDAEEEGRGELEVEERVLDAGAWRMPSQRIMPTAMPPR